MDLMSVVLSGQDSPHSKKVVRLLHSQYKIYLRKCSISKVSCRREYVTGCKSLIQ